MSESTLYRQYRPKTFAEVLGQEAVVASLTGAIAKGRLSHAYLFAGSRGIGKTTVARILAREIGTKPEDIYEIDAASNRGIDEIRALREAVATLPFMSPYKVYIIDEVHMLTKEAFNALLKTLEEPPAHVIFILATTEMHKLPETVVSRCQTLIFKKPSVAQLAEVVKDICRQEKYQISQEGAEAIALVGDGSFRDTLVTLQKVFSISNDKKLSFDEVEKIAGLAPAELVGNFLRAILQGDSEQALGVVEEVSVQQYDLKLFLLRQLELCRAVLLFLLAPKTAEKLLLEDTRWPLIQELAHLPQSKKLSAILRVLLRAYEETNLSYSPKIPLYLAVAEISQQLTDK